MGYLISGGGGGATTFQALTDTPVSYVGNGSKVVAVNVAENAVEFINPPTSLTIANITSASSPYTASVGESVMIDASGGDIIVELPNAAASNDLIYIKRTDTSSNIVTLQSTASAVGVAIEGSSSVNIGPMVALTCVPVSSTDRWWLL